MTAYFGYEIVLMIVKTKSIVMIVIITLAQAEGLGVYINHHLNTVKCSGVYCTSATSIIGQSFRPFKLTTCCVDMPALS